MNHNDIVVSISCITYNHAPYIRQCLDGFMMQKTNFAFEVLIHDDASTDGTTEIIKEYEAKYPEIIKPLYEEENQWVKGRRGSAVFNYPRAKGKYIALCEGDDYWTDPLKLQKQVDFLEANPDYSMCFHAAKLVEDDKIIMNTPFSTIDNREYSGIEVFEIWQVPTASVIFKRDVIESQSYKLVSHSKKFIYGDTPLFCAASCVGKLWGMSIIMSVYQRNEGGVTMGEKPLSFWVAYNDHVLEFGNVFGGDFKQSSKKIAARSCAGVAAHYVRIRNIKDAISIVVYSLKHNTLSTLVALAMYPWQYMERKFKCQNH